MNITQFQESILDWFTHMGRKNLPWQQTPTPYRVWVSEIMLQQTQVTAVIPYYQRFMQQFPDLATLAAAHEDDVLHYWTGLGYYARARNLLKAAQKIQSAFAGIFPHDLETLQTLPGIGRSTAGAIISLAYEKKAAILDGNVKRVLARFHAVDGWPGDASVAKKLWELSEKLTPAQHSRAYTQAMMDLGATVCTRSQPRCLLCPLQSHCKAHQENKATFYPGKKATKQLPIKTTHVVVIKNHDRHIFLEKRPPIGIWGGLWSFPQVDDYRLIKKECAKRLGLQINLRSRWKPFRHTFSHFHLDITVVEADLVSRESKCNESSDTIWYSVSMKNKILGFAAPIKHLLTTLENQHVT